MTEWHTPRGIPVLVVTEEQIAVLALEDHQIGGINTELHPDGFQIDGWQRPGLTDEQIAALAEWMDKASEQLSTTGDPVENGWFPSEYGPRRWFMTAALRVLPDV